MVAQGTIPQAFRFAVVRTRRCGPGDGAPVPKWQTQDRIHVPAAPRDLTAAPRPTADRGFRWIRGNFQANPVLQRGRRSVDRHGPSDPGARDLALRRAPPAGCSSPESATSTLTFTGLTEAILALPRLVIASALWSLAVVLDRISTYSPQQQGELPPTPIPLLVLGAFTSITTAGTAIAVALFLFMRKAIDGLVATYAVLTLIAGLCFLTILGSAFALLFEAIAAVFLGILFLTRRVIGSSCQAETATPGA
jgi:hypothetical protein